MNAGRRSFVSTLAAALAGGSTLLAASQRQQNPPPFVIPDASSRSPRTQQPPDDSTPPAPDPKEQLKESQKNLRRDVDHLVELANALKDEAYKAPQTDVLSLSLIHKAEDIEKLAKQIKDLARG